MKTITLYRGIPGSGKTTAAWRHVNQEGVRFYIVLSADDHFTAPDGTYAFKASELTEAHGSCIRRLVAAITENQVETIVVHNTFISVAEVAPYVAIGEAYGYEVTIVTLDVDVDIAHGRQVHGVPRAKLESMNYNLGNWNPPRRWRLKTQR